MSEIALPAAAPRILNVSFYRFVALTGLEALRDEAKERALEAGLRGSILLSEEGINGFLAGPEAALRPYLAWLFAKEPFRGIVPKESWSSEVPFTRMLVKIKREIISMGCPEIRPSERTGRNLAPAELKRWYDTGKDFIIIDTRNDYEVVEGTFERAVDYGIGTFREFPEKLQKAVPSLRDKSVVMFCTGGIRCEKATALALDLGISDVWQLEGGILKYFEEVGQARYRGDCFVFDRRENLVPTLEARREWSVRERSRGVALVLDGSPESDRVARAARIKGIPFEKEAGRGDLALVRTLEDGSRCETRSGQEILAELERLFPELPALVPSDAERRQRMFSWIDWIDQVLRPEAERWMGQGPLLPADERFKLETRLEKLLHRLKTPLSRARRWIVLDTPTWADLAAHSVLGPLRSTGFPSEYPERYAILWEWMERLESASSPSSSSP